MKFKNVRDMRGFTLVELAIVMVIVGLLIGGILKGSQLIQEAKVKKTMTMVKGIQAAAEIFKSKYNALPGDMLNAQNRLPGCNGICNNGDGNFIIGIQDVTTNVNQTGIAMPDVETSLFWRHLALADLITDVDTVADLSNPVIGETHPAVPMGGGFSVVHRGNRHALSIKGCVNNGSDCPIGAITPAQAARFDDMLDGDQNAREGTVISNGGPDCGFSDGIYTLNSDEVSCYLTIYQNY